MAIVGLVLGIVSWMTFFPLFSAVGLFLCRSELKKIERGESPPGGQQMAQIGFWISLVNLIVAGGFWCLFCGIYLFSFLMVFLSAGASTMAY